MIKHFLISILILFPPQLKARPLCQRLSLGINEYLATPDSRINFKNQGGLLSGGVCWWHARLQRLSAYLTEFEPELSPPSLAEAKKIIKRLKRMDSVVRIPGFYNFNDFSKTYKAEIQLMLEAWQREDGFLNQQWIRGISGKYQLHANEMKDRMDKIYEQFTASPKPLWIMAQIKGVSSHAFLILNMKPQINGYELKVIDSNHPTETRIISYIEGQTFLKHIKDKYSFVPYSGFQDDFERILTTATNYCGNSFEGDATSIPNGEIEVSNSRLNVD